MFLLGIRKEGKVAGTGLVLLCTKKLSQALV